MRAGSFLALTLTAALASCASEHGVVVAPPSPPPVSAPANPAPPPRDDARLPPLAVPERYALAFTIDPNQARFSGSTKILVNVPAPTPYVVLHGRHLDVQRAVARVGGQEVPAEVAARPAHGGTEPEELVLTFARPLPAGHATLEFAYEAPFDDGLAGIYRVMDEEKRWYGFSQFEPTDARRAFPSFDDPSFKVSFDLSITVPRGMIAVANTPETSRTENEKTTTFAFATTPPLPTYLVALAVGDLDIRQGPASPVPIRLLATKGRAKLGDLAIVATAALTRELAGYFGIAYPYPKLDIVAVPNFAAGAMENAGLVTFRDDLLLLDPQHASVKAKRDQAITIAHELAHQWFGDLVTMEWWNDVWLNEGFATWAEAKITDRYRPTYEARTEHIANLSHVMDTDALKSARAVRQPVTSSGEANEAFDEITYDKGAGVLSMIEHSVGEKVFQDGVRAYLAKHAWKNATADDLFSALNSASQKDVASLAASFLDRPGVPEVKVALSCGKTGATLSLEQSPWHSLGESVPEGASSAVPWWVPVGVTSATGERAAKLLSSAKDEIQLTRCAPWAFPNTDSAGYYRFTLDDKGWTEMAKGLGHLDAPNKVGFLSNLWAQTRAGELDPTVVLRVLPSLDGEKDRYVIEQVIDILGDMSEALVSDEARAGYRRYVATRLGPHRAELISAAQRDDNRSLLEPVLVSALGNLADDPAALKDAERVAKAWLANPDAVDADLGPTQLALASLRASADRVDELAAALRRAVTPAQQDAVLRALGSFRDPTALRRALDLTLTDDVRSQDVIKVLGRAIARRESRKVAFDWAAAHWEPIQKKLPSYLLGAYFFSLPRAACSKDERATMTEFFQAHVKETEGADRPLAESLEAARLCETLSDKYTVTVSRFFAAPAPPAAPVAAPPSPPPAKAAPPPGGGRAKKKAAR